MKGPMVALDVGYREGESAVSACVCFDDWRASKPTRQFTVQVTQVAPYLPGKFYKRELPCLLTALETLSQTPEIILVDGHVRLSDEGAPGLGAYLYEALEGNVPVVGIGKTAFSRLDNARKVFRGRSLRPLFVTAVGVSEDDAAKHVKAMHGSSRIPTLLKLVDRLSRTSGTDEH